MSIHSFVKDTTSTSSKHSMGEYEKAVVVTDAPLCSDIGKDILERGGSVADATIACALCVGVIQSQSMGLGGGFSLVYYDAATKSADALSAIVVAPIASCQHEEKFRHNPEKSTIRPFAISVPGELKGYWMLWKKYGRMKWSDLFAPAISLCENGFPVTAHAANAMQQYKKVILESPSLREVFYNTVTNDLYKTGETMTRHDLAKTLKLIADGKEGEEDVLYRGTNLMKSFVDDIRSIGGKICEEDLLSYNGYWEPPVTVNVGDLSLHSSPLPGSGLLLAFIMKLLSQYNLQSDDTLTHHIIVESFKHAFGARTKMGDLRDTEITKEMENLTRLLTSDAYVEKVKKLIHEHRTENSSEYYGAKFLQPMDAGTTHISMLGPNGDAIAFTSSINNYYGAKFRSCQTGIILNDFMDDFSYPNAINSYEIRPSMNNFYKPGKRPVSSMAPTIFLDKNGKVRLILGAAGGPAIATTIACVAVRYLMFGQSLKDAIDARRLHHQLFPMEVQYEEHFDPRIVEGLKKLGHKVSQFPIGRSIVQGVAVDENGVIFGYPDFRKNGTVAGF